MPEFRPAVSAIFDEVEIFGVRHRARRDGKIADQHFVCRPFVVERKAITPVADFISAAGDIEPVERVRFAHADGFFLAKRGCQRVARQHVLDIHQGKFLMLLFVMQSEF